MGGSLDADRVDKLLNDLEYSGLLEIGLVLLGAALAVWLIRRAVPWVAELVPTRFRLYVLGTVPIARLVLMLGAIVWIVPILFNVTLQNFLLIAGAVSVAIGFAFKDYVSSLIAGVVALFESPYRAGDWVKVGDDFGEVRHVGMRSIRLVTPDDDTITVPHSRLWTENVSTSNDGENTLMCVAEFHVAGAHDGAALRSALQDVALTSAYLEYARPVAVIVNQEVSGTRYQVKAYPFDMRDQFLFVSDLTVRGKEAIRELGAREAEAVAVPAPDA